MSPFWQLINRPAEARRKFTFTLRRRIDSTSPRFTTFGTGASGGAAAASALEGIAT